MFSCSLINIPWGPSLVAYKVVIEICCPADAHMKLKAEHPVSQEEGEEDMSGTQFVCETVIRSLTLDAAPDHQPLQRKKSLQSEYFILASGALMLCD